MPKQAKYCQAHTSLGTILKNDTASVGINFSQFQASDEDNQNYDIGKILK